MKKIKTFILSILLTIAPMTITGCNQNSSSFNSNITAINSIINDDIFLTVNTKITSEIGSILRVTNDFKLPYQYIIKNNLATIKWTTDISSIKDEHILVYHEPTENVVANLTATIEYKGKTQSFEHKLTIYQFNDEIKLERATNALKLDLEYDKEKDEYLVYDSIEFPKVGLYGAQITWDPDNKHYIDENGEHGYMADTQVVNTVVRLTLGKYKNSRVFRLRVIGKNTNMELN